MPTSSSRSAVSDGVYSPSAGSVVAGAGRGEPERRRPRTPSAASAPHRRRSRRRSAARVWSAPRSPMAWRRSAACGTWAARSMSWGRRSSASRYSPKLCHDQSRPSWRAEPGMSSTPSISSMRRSWSAGRTGANPTPQLPMTTVVTPCQRRGQQAAVPGGLAVVVAVDVDEAGRDERGRRRRARCRPVPSTRPTSTMRPSAMATSATRPGEPVPSTTVPPRMTRSCSATATPSRTPPPAVLAGRPERSAAGRPR